MSFQFFPVSFIAQSEITLIRKINNLIRNEKLKIKRYPYENLYLGIILIYRTPGADFDYKTVGNKYDSKMLTETRLPVD